MFTSPYEEECQALEDAVEWIEANCDETMEVLICTDSQSLCKAIEGTGEDIDYIRCMLERCKAKVTIQWIPGHCKVPGNE